MTARETATVIAAALALLLSGAAIGAAAVAVHHLDGPALIDAEAGAVDYSETPVSP